MTQFEGRPYFSQTSRDKFLFGYRRQHYTKPVYVGHRQTVVAFEILKAYVFRGSCKFLRVFI